MGAISRMNSQDRLRQICGDEINGILNNGGTIVWINGGIPEVEGSTGQVVIIDVDNLNDEEDRHNWTQEDYSEHIQYH